MAEGEGGVVVVEQTFCQYNYIPNLTSPPHLYPHPYPLSVSVQRRTLGFDIHSTPNHPTPLLVLVPILPGTETSHLTVESYDRKPTRLG